MLGNMTKDGISTKIDLTKSQELKNYLSSLTISEEFFEEYTWFFACLTESEDT